jgi:hypothetical protein
MEKKDIKCMLLYVNGQEYSSQLLLKFIAIKNEDLVGWGNLDNRKIQKILADL